MLKHTGPISGVATCGDQFVATAGYDNRVILWNGATGAPLARGFHDHLANQCQFSPCGKYLLSASSDYSARLWSVPDMRLLSVFGDHRDDVEMAIFIDDGKGVATCSRDHTLRTFDLSGRLLKVFEGHTADVISAAWDTSSRTLLSSSDDGTLRRWDVESGLLLETIDLDQVETDTVAVTERGGVFAGNDQGEIICVAPHFQRVKAHAAGIKRLVYSSAAGLLVSMSYDRQAALWSIDDRAQLREVGRTEIPSIVWARSCAFLGTSQVITASFGSTYASFDLRTSLWDSSRIESSTSLNAVRLVDDSIYSVGDAGIVYRDGRQLSSAGSLCNFLVPFAGRVLTGGQMGRLFDASTGRVLHQHRSPLNCGATFERNGQEHLIVGTYTGEGLVFRMDGDNLSLNATLALGENAIKGVACSDAFIFSVCANASISWFSIPDFQCVKRLANAHDRIINGCATMGSNLFASISRDLTLRVWQDGVASVFPSPHRNSIKCIAASSDGRYIATASYGGTIAIFDIETRKWIVVTRVSAAGISCITTGARNGEFLASSYDGRIHHVMVHGIETTQSLAATQVTS
jgi:toxoflavin biosynthesis protein ToxC